MSFADLKPGAAPGCDAMEFGEGPPSMLDGRCRCMTCGRCGHHCTNTHQGHYSGYCRVTGTFREPHFCCSDPAFGCELEQAAVGGQRREALEED